MKLEKKLGLADVFAIATGAMISSGLFLLPGIAAAQTGLSVFLAYLIAGALMVPAMLSQAELATAMPRAGGAYYFLDRAMGPLVGTVGGLGTWVALVFKSGFGLIGMGAYVALFLDVPILTVALVLCAVLCVANIIGAKESSGLQRALVGTLLVATGAFVLLGAAGTHHYQVQLQTDQRFLIDGVDGLLGTVGLVFVSYAGLTKVASVAEEIKDPDRNIPLGMMLSLGVATAVYSVCVVMISLVVHPAMLHSDLAPMATAAAEMAGPYARPAVAVTAVAAVAAFASTANAGILSASRYPLAMARDRLLPAAFSRIGRFGTPVTGVVATSLAIAVCISVLEIATVAKLASAFQLLLFSMINLCVIIMREGKLNYYRPGYRSPFYPALQIAGIVFPLWLIAEMGWVPMAFTAGLVFVSGMWFKLYAAGHVQRQGAILHVFERLGRRRWAGLDDELRRVLHDKGLQPDDPLFSIIQRAPSVRVETTTFEEVARSASELFAATTSLDVDELCAAFVAENRFGMMPMVGTSAFPHHQYEGLSEPEIVVVYAPAGVQLKLDRRVAHVEPAAPLTVFVFLLGPDRDAARHYRMLAHLTGLFEQAEREGSPDQSGVPSALNVLVGDSDALERLITGEEPRPGKVV